MADQPVNTRYRRRPWLAVVLSLIMPGLGHIYAGRLVRGLVFAFVYFIPMIALQVGLLTAVPTGDTLMVLAVILGSLVIPLVALMDSYYLAKHTRTDYQLKEYNRWYVYLLLALISTSSGTQISLSTRANYLEAFRVPAASMYPTIVPDDRILTDKTAYRTEAPERGDVIVFLNPDNRRINYIKRVIAVAGDTVEIRDNGVFVNDRELTREKVPAANLDKIRIKVKGKAIEGDIFEEVNGRARYRVIFAEGPGCEAPRDFAKITVPKNHCFVLGDNRNCSTDSRKFGPVSLGDIKGRAYYLYFPAKDWSRFGRLDK